MASGWIVALNILLGWTLFGWVIALGCAAAGKAALLPAIPPATPLPGR